MLKMLRKYVLSPLDWKTRVDVRMEETAGYKEWKGMVGEKLDSLPRIERRIDRIDGRIDRIDDRIDRIDGRIDRIDDNINKIFARLPPAAIASDSPIRLTDLGERISDDIGAKEWVRNESRSLLDKLKGKEAFEIQDFAFEHVKRIEPAQEIHTEMKRSAFNHGMDLEIVQSVLGVELRDELLRQLGIQ